VFSFTFYTFSFVSFVLLVYFLFIFSLFFITGKAIVTIESMDAEPSDQKVSIDLLNAVNQQWLFTCI
jgi:hypothetical protein